MSRLTLVIVLLALAACDQANNNPANLSGKPGAPADSKQRNSGASTRGEAELPSLERLTGDTDRVPDVMNGLVAHIYAIRPDAEEIGAGWGYGISGKAKKSDNRTG